MKNSNLVESVFSKNWDFESGILCTYGLNLNFFENYLMKLDALYTCDNICIFIDSRTYEGFIKESYNPRWLNKKYLVNQLKAGGVFHPKLYMFASEKRAVIGIGSANLTRDGITSNLELISSFEVSEKDPSCASLLRDCIKYVRKLAQISKSKHATDQIDVFNQLCTKYLSSDEENEIQFIHNLDIPLIESIKESVKDFNISKIQVISPFYDTELAALTKLQDIFPKSDIEIYLQQKKSNFPKEIFANFKSNTSLLLFKKLERYLHGKAILLHSSDEVILFSGSANFTRSALIETPPNGNYEIGLLGRIDRKLAKELINPTGNKPTKVKNIKEIEINPETKFEALQGCVDYITEAVLDENIIKIEINADIPLETFTPKKFKLRDFDNNEYEEKISNNFEIEVTPNIKNKVPGKMAIQIIGSDENDRQLESNTVWLIELEEKSDDSFRRKFRRIYNDPFELAAVLREILKTGDEEELKLFLLKFDIPLDLILPPRNYQRSKNIESKGNIEGALPTHRGYNLSTSMKNVYSDCLDRLYHKLKDHLENPQIKNQ